jgi:hypothetical protein
MSEMRETHRLCDRSGKRVNWFSAARHEREGRCHLHGMHPEENVTNPTLLRTRYPHYLTEEDNRKKDGKMDTQVPQTQSRVLYFGSFTEWPLSVLDCFLK